MSLRRVLKWIAAHAGVKIGGRTVREKIGRFVPRRFRADAPEEDFGRAPGEPSGDYVLFTIKWRR